MKTLDQWSVLRNFGHAIEPICSAPEVGVSVCPDYEIEVDRIEESEWSQFMDKFADSNIYQTWSYGAARWGESNLSHLVLKQGDEVQGLAQLRIIRPGGLRVGVAYLRWGPLCHRRGQLLEAKTVARLARALRQEYIENRRLYLEILPNAFSGSPRAHIIEPAFGQFDRGAGINAENYRTLVLDLSPSLEEVRKNLDKKWRNQLNASERNGLTIIEGCSTSIYRKFCTLYRQMCERKMFHTNVRIEEFEQIQERLPANQKMNVLICEHKGQPVAGLVSSAIGESAIYLLGATNDQGMKIKASYLLQWTIIQRLKQSGILYYDLGGIDPKANPGVYHFKSGLSGADVSHISPFVACENRFSAAFAQAGQVVHRSLQGLRQQFARA